jgi:transcriptional regulator with XRE-family HTH domain
MGEKNKAFKKVFEWLYKEGKAIDQKDIAKKTGISATTISRIMNHGVGRPDEKTVRKLNAAFDNIFNPDFLMGNSDEMFLDNDYKQEQPVIPEYSSMINSIIAAKDETIESLKSELLNTEESLKSKILDREELVKSIRSQLATKDILIESLRQQVTDLRAALAEQQKKDSLGNYPFTPGVADDGERASTGT